MYKQYTTNMKIKQVYTKKAPLHHSNLRRHWNLTYYLIIKDIFNIKGSDEKNDLAIHNASCKIYWPDYIAVSYKNAYQNHFANLFDCQKQAFKKLIIEH